MAEPIARADCPQCAGRGWLVVSDGGAGTARPCPCRQEMLVPRLLEMSGIPLRYRNCTLDNFKVSSPDSREHERLLEGREKCRRYVEGFLDTRGSFQEAGLLLVGPPGAGKTHLAAAVLSALIRRFSLRGRFVDFSSLIHQIQSTFDPSSAESKHDVLDPVMDAELLVIDELGAQKPTPFVTDTLYLILNHRYTRRLPTIFTTNFRLEKGKESNLTSLDLLEARLTPHLVSRLYEMAAPVALEVADFRKEIGRDSLPSKVFAGVTGTRLSALDALARGMANVRANRELVGVQIVAGLLMAASIVIPVLLFLKRLGIPLTIFLKDDPQAVRDALESMQLDLGHLSSMLGLGLVLFLVAGTLVFLAYCWFQAGTLAVLLAGEAQAPRIRQSTSAVFRTFSWSDFYGWASRYGLRIFGVLNLFLVLATVALGLLLLPLLLVGRLQEGSGTLLACAAGCGLALPIGFLLLVLALATIVAQICAVEAEATVRGATKRAFAITGNRLGGLLLLYLLYFCGWIAVNVFFGVVGLVAKLALARWEVLLVVTSATLGVVQFALGVALALVLTAAIVALVRAEPRLLAASARPVV